MNVSAIQSGQSIYEAAAAQQRENTAPEATANQKTTTDSVDISAEAKAMAETSAAKKELEPPIESFAVPQWMVDRLPNHSKPLLGRLGLCMEDDALSSDYSKKVQKYFMQERQRQVAPQDSYSDNIFENKDYSEKVHQAVHGRLASDPKAVELSKYLNSIGELEYTLLDTPGIQ